MNRFIIDGQYREILKFYGINAEEALRKAGLPEDLFSHKTPVMEEEEYFRFMEAIDSLITDPAIPIYMASTEKTEIFSPPIFASYCSKNGSVCLERLARYKKLIGPMVFLIRKGSESTEIELKTATSENELPQFLVETELVFLLNIIRKATKETIVPLLVQMKKPVDNEPFHTFLGLSPIQADKNGIVFANEDLEKPFISFNESIWDYFEPELSRRLAELDIDDSTSARVRSALTELMPGGQCGIEEVAAKLGMSKRTLQRKLSEENTTFQKQLNSTRKELAIHYIRNTTITTNDMAYLLGYQELNSFLRAFTTWTGLSIHEYKKQMQK